MIKNNSKIKISSKSKHLFDVSFISQRHMDSKRVKGDNNSRL